MCKVGVLQYFLCNYTLAHFKTAVLTLFLCIYVFECVIVQTNNSLLCTEESEDMGSKITIVIVS